MVHVKKERFEKMYKKRNYSERKLGLELATHSKEEGGISYRSFQRCLQFENMKYETLELCAEILKPCSIDYLRGIDEIDNNADGFFTEEQFLTYKLINQLKGYELDDKGNVIGDNTQYYLEKAYPHFRKFVETLSPILSFRVDVRDDAEFEDYNFKQYVKQEEEYLKLVDDLTAKYLEDKGYQTDSQIDTYGLFYDEMIFVFNSLTRDMKNNFKKTYQSIQSLKSMTPEQFMKSQKKEK